MHRYFITFLMLGCVVPVSFAATIPAYHSTLSLQREQRRMELDELQYKQQQALKKNAPLQETTQVPIVAEYGTPIRFIYVEGETPLSSHELAEIIAPFKWHKGGVPILNLMRLLENKHLELGYIATRVKIDLKRSDFKNGRVAYKIIAGRVEKVVYKDGNDAPKPRNLRTFFTFPINHQDPIQIADLDQGIENINSVSRNNARFKLEAGENLGGTVVVVENTPKNFISGSLNVNNLGQDSTGKYRGKVSLNFEDMLGLNEFLNLNYQRRLAHFDKFKDNQNFGFYFSLPFRYWSLNVAKSQSEYATAIHALNQTYRNHGVSNNLDIGVRRLINRNANGKVDTGLSLTHKKTESYLEDIQLVSSSRKLTIGKLDFNAQQKLFGGVVNVNLAYLRGLPWFDSQNDLSRDDGVPKAHFNKFTLDLNYYRPFAIKKQNFTYNFSFSGQYSPDILYPSEKLAIGDDTTVRGFKENSILGDKGYYVRNELSYQSPYYLEPFVAFDLGQVKDNYHEPNAPRYTNFMSGVSIGTRLRYKALFTSLTYSKPIHAPSYVVKNNHEFYGSLSLSF